MTLEECVKKIIKSDDLLNAASEAFEKGEGDKFLKEHGFEYTEKEIIEFLKSSPEINDDALGKVAGGHDVLNALLGRGRITWREK